MSKMILACTSLKDYVVQTQNILNTDYPVTYVSRIYHRDPKEMREHLLDALAKLPEEVDTVLVAMGYCGGSWEDVKAPVRIVIPRVDDCVSLLLQTGEEVISDLKKPGHLYVRDKDPSKECFKRIFDNMAAAQDLDEETVNHYHEVWKSYYSNIDIIDTGINDCHRPDYVASVQADCDWLEAELGFVNGGTHLLEKLLVGDWDEQFLVLEPGERSAKDKVLAQA